MNPGIGSNSFAAQTRENNNSKVSREQLNEFLGDVTYAMQAEEVADDGLPWVEAPAEIINFYTDRRSFESGSLSFVFQNVRVFEKGRRDEALLRAGKSISDKIINPPEPKGKKK
jgi:hypothetical protein